MRLDYVSTCLLFLLFFFNDTATSEIYTLSLHDALPISLRCSLFCGEPLPAAYAQSWQEAAPNSRSEEHTSELQSHSDLVCRLLLEKKNHGAGVQPRSRTTQECSVGRKHIRIADHHNADP